jgi:molybdenum cofactor sulfurtransferase
VGEYIGYSEVEKLAAAAKIQLRTGCFCNPGACQQAIGLTSDMVRANLEAGHRCWYDNDQTYPLVVCQANIAATQPQ